MSKFDKRKIRDLVPEYEKLIISLVTHAKDIHELEFSDSERAAVRAKARLREHKALVQGFYDKIEDIRVEIVSKKS